MPTEQTPTSTNPTRGIFEVLRDCAILIHNKHKEDPPSGWVSNRNHNSYSEKIFLGAEEQYRMHVIFIPTKGTYRKVEFFVSQRRHNRSDEWIWNTHGLYLSFKISAKQNRVNRVDLKMNNGERTPKFIFSRPNFRFELLDIRSPRNTTPNMTAELDEAFRYFGTPEEVEKFRQSIQNLPLHFV